MVFSDVADVIDVGAAAGVVVVVVAAADFGYLIDYAKHFVAYDAFAHNEMMTHHLLRDWKRWWYWRQLLLLLS